MEPFVRAGTNLWKELSDEKENFFYLIFSIWHSFICWLEIQWMFIKCFLCARLLVGPMAMTFNKARLSSVLHMSRWIGNGYFPVWVLWAVCSVECRKGRFSWLPNMKLTSTLWFKVMEKDPQSNSIGKWAKDKDSSPKESQQLLNIWKDSQSTNNREVISSSKSKTLINQLFEGV